jgi:hypothetical protein
VFGLVVVSGLGLIGCDDGGASVEPDASEPSAVTTATDAEGYCAAVDDYVTLVREADPSADTSALVEVGDDLADQARHLVSASIDDAERILACSQEAAAAIPGG